MVRFMLRPLYLKDEVVDILLLLLLLAQYPGVTA